MKKVITSGVLLAVLSLFAGCACPRKAPPAQSEAEFRRQLAQSVPVREYGYTIEELRFSKDRQKALVVFANSDVKRPDWEFVLERDSFGRYRGRSMQPFYTPGTANTPSVQLTVTLPDN